MNPKQVSDSLKLIAAKLDNSKNPERRLVAMELKRVLAALKPWPIKFTTYDGMNNASGGFTHVNPPTDTFKEVQRYLASGSDKAVVVENESGSHFAVWGGPGGYFYQQLPLEDPNDADLFEGSIERLFEDMLP